MRLGDRIVLSSDIRGFWVFPKDHKKAVVSRAYSIVNINKKNFRAADWETAYFGDGVTKYIQKILKCKLKTNERKLL